jgi:[ribosomal protein S18]-alanine N-acetyltransferase
MSQPPQSSRDRPTGLGEVTPPYRVRQLSIEDGMEIAMWRLPGPWAVHDALEAPRDDEGYWAVEDSTGRLVGYCCFGQAARPPGLQAAPGMLDVALGLRPDLIGRGLSAEFARAVVAHAHEVAARDDLAAGRRLRTVVATNNVPGRRAAEGTGFTVTGAYEVPGGAAVSSYLVLTHA